MLTRFLPILMVLVAVLRNGPTAAGEPLPAGDQPQPVAVPHFPDRLHAVVWRNWGLVEPARLATVLGGTAEQITAVAASMGLPPVVHVQPEWRRRGYITIVRRNWHLLPYDQLLGLLDMTADELAVALREDDFLWHKLGGSKPRCEPVRYAEPGVAARQREAAIKRVVERYFGDALAKAAEPAFAFVGELSRPPTLSEPPKNGGGLRFIYSYFGTFGDPLADPSLDPYPDGLLARLAANGVNGVWLHVVLRQLAPGGPDFPEFGAGHEQRLATLRALVERAKRHGIAVYLYLNEPRAMPASFFERRPEMMGVAEGDLRAPCTSDPRVRRWLEDSVAHVFRAVPGLGGVFTITASENLTSWASHGHPQACPRCGKRNPDDVIAEVNATIAAGVRRSAPDAKVIVWDWGWHNHGDAPDLIAKSPKGAWLMSVSEWGLPVERGGVRTTVGEYSMSAVGPGPRATRHWALAKQAGLKTVAKVAFNNTWELSAVPYLPVMDLVAEHCSRLGRVGVDGVMLSWSLGGYPSPNLRIARRFADEPTADPAAVLDELARDLYGPAGAPHARRAWTAFSRAFAEYPYCGAVVYHAPQQFGPANLLYDRPTGRKATMIGFPYDDVAGWRGPYPPAVFARQWEKMAAGWADGLAGLRQAVDAAPPEKRAAAEADLRLARAAGLHFRSVGQQVRFVLARDSRQPTGLILDAEIQAARELFDLCRADSRIGFEASNHYYYVPLDLVEKVVSCEYIRNAVRAP
ncbi:MAG TPA: hypothetical protein VGF55_09425 [Gemmataceae bacterium]